MGERFKREGTHEHLRTIPLDVWQKQAQHCKAIIPQLKKKKPSDLTQSSVDLKQIDFQLFLQYKKMGGGRIYLGSAKIAIQCLHMVSHMQISSKNGDNSCWEEKKEIGRAVVNKGSLGGIKSLKHEGFHRLSCLSLAGFLPGWFFIGWVVTASHWLSSCQARRGSLSSSSWSLLSSQDIRATSFDLLIFLIEMFVY